MLNSNTIIVNGKKIKFSGNAVINIRKDVSSEKEKKFDTDNKSRMFIEIEGDVGDIICDDANILVNGNVERIITKTGNVKCNDINGKVVGLTVEANNIRGYISTNSDIVTDTFIGNTNIGKVVDNFKPVLDKNTLQEDMTIYHKKYGKGVIKSVWNYNVHTGGSISVDFDSEDYNKTLFLDKVIKNGSISIFNIDKIEKEYEKEYSS